jgi:hypothetical protein
LDCLFAILPFCFVVSLARAWVDSSFNLHGPLLWPLYWHTGA